MLRTACLAVVLAAPALAWAGPASGSANPAAPAAAASAPQPGGVDRRVIEDDGVRIEELRVRGQVQSVTVQSKQARVAPYEIVVGRGGRDPSQETGSAGRRVWSLSRF